MAKEFGTPLVRKINPHEIVLKPGDAGYHSCGDMSAETRREIEEIEKNIRQAMASAHKFVVG